MFEKVINRVILVAVRAMTKEIRELREVLQVGIDSQREMSGYPPIYTPVVEDEQAAKVARVAHAEGIIRQGDFLSWWVIDELAREAKIPLTEGMNLEQLALDRGWIDPRGVFLVMPAMAIHEIGADAIAELMQMPLRQGNA